MPLADPRRQKKRPKNGSTGPINGDDKRNLNPVGTWVRQAKRGNRKAARNLQRWLRHQGYGLKVDGKWGPATQSALKHYRSGNTAPTRWSPPAAKARGNPVNRFNRSGNANAPVQANFRTPKGGGGGKAKKPKKPTNAQNFAGLEAQFGGANSWKTGTPLGPGYGEAAAGLEFDAPIQDLKTLIARLGPQNDQAIADIGNWYGDVEELSQRASQRAGDIAGTTANAQDQAIMGLMGALGGAGNDANSQIAAANVNDTGYQRVLGAVEQQYHQDMSPVYAEAGADAKKFEQRRNMEQMQEYQMKLAQMLGQRGQRKVTADAEAKQFDSELAQQWFQNRLAQVNASLGAQAAGVDMALKKESLAGAKAQRKAATSPGGFTPWKKLNPVERTQMLQAAVYKPDGSMRSYQAASNFLVSMGYAAGNRSTHNPAITQALRSFYH